MISVEKHHFNWNKVGIIVLIIFVVLIFIFPIYWMIITSFKSDADILTRPPTWWFKPTIKNYIHAFKHANFGLFMVNSLIVAVTSTIIVVCLSFLCAYGFARYNTVGRDQFMFFILSTRMFPQIAVVIPYFVLFRNFRLLDTRIAMIILYTMFNLPFAIWLMHSFIKDIPVDLEEAARVDGYSRWRILRKIILPLVAPGLAVTAIFCLLFSWNEFLFAFLLTRTRATTITVGVSSFWTQRGILWGPLCAAAAVCVIPMMIFVALLQKYIVRGLTFGAIKG